MLSHNDINGAFGSVSLAITGTVIANIQAAHIPPIVIESCQVLSYCGGALIACVTLYKHFKKKQ